MLPSWSVLVCVAFLAAQTVICTEYNDTEDYSLLDEKAAPWWEQQEEAAKRRCQSSCTAHSKGVKNPQQITLCDDTEVAFLYLKVDKTSLFFLGLSFESKKC